MIVSYKKSKEKLNCFTVIPEGMPWRLEIVITEKVEAAKTDSGYVIYALNLVVGKDYVDTILSSDELWGVADHEYEDEMLLALMEKIVELTMYETEQIMDLGTILDTETKFWRAFQKVCTEE